MKVRCTRSQDGRFKVGKIYTLNEDGSTTDEHWNPGYSCRTDSFEHWYEDCKWRDYDFELVEESKMFTKDDIRSGDKIVTEFGRGMVVEFNGKRVIRYDDDTNGHDIVDTISPERIKAVIRPAEDYQLRVDKFSDGTVVFDREKGIGCEPPTPPVKEISVDEATKLLTEKFGQNVRIRVGE